MAVTTLATLKHVGGHPALDFVNTRHHWVGTGPDREYLADYADLVRWSHDAGVLSSGEARALSRQSASDPSAAARAHRESIALRDVIHETFQASIVGRQPDSSRLRVFNTWYQRALRHRRFTGNGRGDLGVEWNFDAAVPPLELPLLKLAYTAVEFAQAVAPGRLKECPGQPGCGWLFYDTSKNRSRRWCDMSDCGNVAKARRHYVRVRRARSGSP